MKVIPSNSRVNANLNRVNPAEERKVTIGKTEYSLGNVTTMSEDPQWANKCTFTIRNYVSRGGAMADTRTVFEKMMSSGSSSRYDVSVPFDHTNQDQVKKVKQVMDKYEDYTRSRLQELAVKYNLSMDHDELIKIMGYRRAKSKLPYDMEISEAELRAKAGHLMAKKSSGGSFNLQIRGSIRDIAYDKMNSGAWRDTETGRAGVYNASGMGTLPLIGEDMVNDAIAASEAAAKLYIPIVSGCGTDVDAIWNGLYESLSNVHIWEKYNKNQANILTEEDEVEIDKISDEIVKALI